MRHDPVPEPCDDDLLELTDADRARGFGRRSVSASNDADPFDDTPFQGDPGWQPDRDEMSDWEGTAANRANRANPSARQTPMPLFRPVPSGQPFPVDAMGTLAGAVRAIADIVQCDPALAAGSVLAAVSLAVQGRADVILPIGDGQPRPTSLFVLTIADSGERKSTADRLAMQPVADFERELSESHVRDMARWQADVDAWQAARKKAIGGGKGDWKANADAVEALGPEPAKPCAPILTVDAPTLQGVERAFVEGRPSLGLMSDEGARMLGGWSMSSEQRGATLGGLNSLWDGGPIRAMRAGDGSRVMHGRRLALHLMVQPVVAPKLMADREASGMGVTARLLVAAPSPRAGTRMQRPAKPESISAHATYCVHLGKILRLPPITAPDDPRHLKPRPLPMTTEAATDWRAYCDRCELRLAPGGEWERVKTWGAKAAEHAARLAGVLAVWHDPEGVSAIEVDMMRRGIELAEFYGSEMLRLHDDAGVSAELRDAAQLLQWLQGRGSEAFPLAAVYQQGPTAFRTASKARAGCDLLTEHGHLIRLGDGMDAGDGKRHREAWRLAVSPEG